MLHKTCSLTSGSVRWLSVPLAAFLGLVLSHPAGGGSGGWKAIGHEPSWSIMRTDTQLTLETDFGATRRDFPLPPAGRIDEQTVSYSSSAKGSKLQMTVKQAVCIDSMTGMPRPDQVTVQIDERSLSGCGGDPASLLQRNEWKVVYLAGKAALADPIISVNFSSEGRVSGSASCNRFGASYALTGEGLNIEKGMSSMMVCDPPIMKQEQEFLRLFEETARFSIAPSGSLVLHTADQDTIDLVKH